MSAAEAVALCTAVARLGGGPALLPELQGAAAEVLVARLRGDRAPVTLLRALADAESPWPLAVLRRVREVPPPK